ncbi:MAG: CD225/dispanin family protein [Candidatus Hydrogenedentes bacterium]|nr:CD225/dispanin family protein [Candidatus Hydrogenedentota bacterium]
MYCPKCGSENDDNAFRCTRCGNILQQTQGSPGGPPPSIPTYLAPAILVTLFCCLPFGIVAIVYAAQVSGRMAGGDYIGAAELSRKAKMWCWVSFGIGLAFIVLYVVFIVAVEVLGGFSQQM